MKQLPELQQEATQLRKELGYISIHHEEWRKKRAALKATNEAIKTHPDNPRNDEK